MTCYCAHKHPTKNTHMYIYIFIFLAFVIHICLEISKDINSSYNLELGKALKCYTVIGWIYNWIVHQLDIGTTS